MIARYDSTKSSYFIYSGTWYVSISGSPDILIVQLDTRAKLYLIPPIC